MACSTGSSVRRVRRSASESMALSLREYISLSSKSKIVQCRLFENSEARDQQTLLQVSVGLSHSSRTFVCVSLKGARKDSEVVTAAIFPNVRAKMLLTSPARVS